MSFVLAHTEPGVPIEEVCDRIQRQTGLMALSQSGFTWRTITYYVRRTGIPVNFGITIMLGFIIGAAIAGQHFTCSHLDNLKQFGALKAMGVGNLRIVGHGADAGAGGRCAGLCHRHRSRGRGGRDDCHADQRHTTGRVHGVADPVGTAAAAALIVTASALVSLRRVLTLEPASVFR